MQTQYAGVDPATLPRASETGRLQYRLEETPTTPEGFPPNLLMRFDRVISPEVNKLVVDAWDKVVESGIQYAKADPNRSGTPALHLGSWCINQSEPIITADSRAPHQKEETEIAIDAFLKIINKCVAPRIESFFKDNFPEQYKRLKRYVYSLYYIAKKN